MLKTTKTLLATGLIALGPTLPATAQDQVRTTSITAYTGFYIYVADTWRWSGR